MNSPSLFIAPLVLGFATTFALRDKAGGAAIAEWLALRVPSTSASPSAL
jgi:hypothetical protein